MRYLIAAAAIALLAVPAHADTMGRCGAAWQLKAPETAVAKTYQAWSAICLKANYKTAPGTPGAPPPGATGQCKDGTYTMAKNHQGACSNHGGVAKWQ